MPTQIVEILKIDDSVYTLLGGLVANCADAAGAQHSISHVSYDGHMAVRIEVTHYNGGTANALQRQFLAPIARWLHEDPRVEPRVVIYHFALFYLRELRRWHLEEHARVNYIDDLNGAIKVFAYFSALGGEHYLSLCAHVLATAEAEAAVAA